MNIATSVSAAIGDTPLVDLSLLCEGRATILGKLEAKNPGGSAKDRIARAQKDGGPQTLMKAFPASGTHILPAVGGHGGTHGVKRAGQKPADLSRRRHCRHRVGSQRVGGALQYDTADGGDGIL